MALLDFTHGCLSPLAAASSPRPPQSAGSPQDSFASLRTLPGSGALGLAGGGNSSNCVIVFSLLPTPQRTERRRREDAKEMAQGFKADQRKLDGRGLKGVRVEHPPGNQPFFACFSDQTEMAFPFCILFPQDHAFLPVQRMVGVTDLDPSSVMMGSMPSLRSPVRRRCSPICRATPTGWRSRTARLIAHDERGVTFHYKDYRVGRPGAAQGHDAGNGRVHPPLSAPYPAEGLPPHPPLRAVRQWRAAPPTSRGCASCSASCRAAEASASPSQDEPAGEPRLAAMPLLRRAHDRHRVLRAGNAAAVPGTIPGRHPDRYVMSWNLLLERPMLPRSIAALKPQSPPFVS